MTTNQTTHRHLCDLLRAPPPSPPRLLMKSAVNSLLPEHSFRISYQYLSPGSKVHSPPEIIELRVSSQVEGDRNEDWFRKQCYA